MNVVPSRALQPAPERQTFTAPNEKGSALRQQVKAAQAPRRRALAQGGRFAAVGLIGFAVDGGVLTLLMRRGHTPLEARFVSFFAAVTITWLLNRLWTFSAVHRANRGRQYLGYVSTQIVGAGVNLGVFFSVLAAYPVMYQYPLVPLAAGASVGLLVNFAAAKALVFR